MHTNKNMWTVKLVSFALVCSFIWATVDHFGGYLSRALGWDHFPLNFVVGVEIGLWAIALWLFKVIDDVVAHVALALAILIFFVPHSFASWDFTTSLAVYNQKVSLATTAMIVLSVVAATTCDVFRLVKARAADDDTEFRDEP